jgi:eukaryotic-like serine/threonine-protein kinase
VTLSRRGRRVRRCRRLSGDLDTIVLKCLRKEPQRRYDSAEQLSEDIRRHLEGLPVTAQRDTFAYRGRKFLGRHKAAIAAAVLVTLTLVCGMAATVRQGRIAERERAKAEAESVRARRRFDDLHELLGSLLFEVDAELEKLRGSAPARELVAKRTLAYLDRLAPDAGDDISFGSNLAAAYTRLGDVQGNPFYPNIGDTAGALQSYRKALDLAEAMSARAPENATVRHTLWNASLKYGDILAAIGDNSGALVNYRRAQSAAEALRAENPADDSAREAVGASLDRNGNMMLGAGRPAEALENFTKALAVFEELSAAAPADDSRLRDVAISEGKIGDALLMQGDTAAALRRYGETLATDEARLAADPANSSARTHLAFTYGCMGDARAAAGDRDGALRLYRTQLSLYREMSEAGRADADDRYGMMQSLVKIGGTLLRTGDTPGAVASYRRALKISRALAAQKGQAPGRCYDLGRLNGLVASDPRVPPVLRAAHAREARMWYQVAREFYADLRSLFPAQDVAGRDELARRLAECETALARLR